MLIMPTHARMHFKILFAGVVHVLGERPRAKRYFFLGAGTWVGPSVWATAHVREGVGPASLSHGDVKRVYLPFLFKTKNPSHTRQKPRELCEPYCSGT